MKKIISILLVVLMASTMIFASGAKEETKETKDYHIGIVTGTVSQSEDDLRGAEALIAKYGSVADGGKVQHVTYPDNFASEQETTISVMVGLADDPLMKAVIVNQSIPGTTEAFKKIREKRPDILLFAGESHEDPLVIQSVADLSVGNDFVTRGYLIIDTAKKLGCDTFIHISFPRHMSYESLSRRRDIMKEACADNGMEFVFVTAPDPLSDVGVAGAQQYILQQIPSLLDKYGDKAAFFCTNDAHTEPLLKQLIDNKAGYFIEADLPSPLMGYPGALGIDLKNEQGDFDAILKKVEKTVVERGGAGRFGTWAASFGYSLSVALGEHAINVIEGRSEVAKMSDVIKAFETVTPGIKWNGTFYKDASTKVRAKNYMLVYQDTYMMGKGFMNTPAVEIPSKFTE